MTIRNLLLLLGILTIQSSESQITGNYTGYISVPEFPQAMKVDMYLTKVANNIVGHINYYIPLNSIATDSIKVTSPNDSTLQIETILTNCIGNDPFVNCYECDKLIVCKITYSSVQTILQGSWDLISDNKKQSMYSCSGSNKCFPGKIELRKINSYVESLPLYVKENLEKWKKKGEFETMKDYENRISTSTEKKENELVDAYLSSIFKLEDLGIKYNSESEEFTFTSSYLDAFTLKVSLTEAKDFAKNFKTAAIATIHFSWDKTKNTLSINSLKLIFPVLKKTYSYPAITKD